LQNCEVYNTRESDQPPSTLPPSGQDYCPRAHYILLVQRDRTGQYSPPRPLPCLLLKPTSAHHANCPISFACRPTRASVLSGHIDSVSVAAIICHASQWLLLRVTLPGLPYTARPTVSCRSYSVYNPSQASYNCVSLPLTKVVHLYSLLFFACYARSATPCYARSPLSCCACGLVV
jgi:hypothetical protein